MRKRSRPGWSRVLMLMVLLAALACTDAPEKGGADESGQDPAPLTPAPDQEGTDQQPAPTAAAEPQPTEQALHDTTVSPTRLAIEFSGRPPSQEQSLAVIQTRIAEQERADDRGPTPPPPPRPQLLVKGGTIAAPALGMMWQRSAAGVFTYDDAEVYCRNLSLAGYTDWRLPAISELEKIAGSGYQPISRVPVRTLWSSTPLQRGRMVYDLKADAPTFLTSQTHVICMRRLR